MYCAGNNSGLAAQRTNSRRINRSRFRFTARSRTSTTTDRDRKELLRTLLEEVILHVERQESRCRSDAALAGRHDYQTGCAFEALVKRTGRPPMKIPSPCFAGWLLITRTRSSPASSIAKDAETVTGGCTGVWLSYWTLTSSCANSLP